MNNDVWRDFVRRYRPDPVLFAEEMLKIELQPHQKQVLEWIRDGERRISIRSGHGVGKSCLLAIIMVWHSLLKFPQKCLATAPTKPQLNDALASEVKKWFRALPEPLDDLVNEVHLLMESTGHPNVQDLVDFSIDQQHVCIVSSLCRGGDLNQALELRGSLCEEDAKSVMGGLLRGVSFLHSRGVVHRDLKMENILLVDSRHDLSKVKIIDVRP